MTTTRQPRSTRPPQTAKQPAQGDATHRTAPAAIVAVRRIFAAETGNYFLLLGTTLFMVILGLVMVLSASSISSYRENESDAFALFAKQGLYATIGVPLMLIASRLPPTFWKRWAWHAIIIGIVLQLLVFTPLGYGYGGNQNWLKIGSFTAQPSELVKIALVVWLAYILSSKLDRLDQWRELALPIGPVAGIAVALVLLGNDLGTVFIMVAIILGAMFFAGVRLRYLGLVIVGLGLVALAFASLSSSRSARISALFSGCATESDNAGYCWQTVHGWWALASGGIFGVGLGNSKAKWSWLPEADNDFIFAIIGEELGLIGAIVVLLLFVVLAIAFVRIMRANTDPFARIATSGVMVWVIGQALVNIAVVLGILPVLGVPLPLISAGGSALIATLAAIGVVLSFARQQPDRSGADSLVTRGTDRRMRLAPVPETPAERSRRAAAQRARQRS
jgi:cell division protein FtsW